jgi:hypothetical protein
MYSVPAAGFAAGGIPEWLREGINGHLASSDPPTPEGLAQAIFQCLRDPGHHARLRVGALAVAREYNMAGHLHDLSVVFRRAFRS